MAFDPNFDPDGIDHVHIEHVGSPMDDNDADSQIEKLSEHLYSESVAILTQVKAAIGVAAGIVGDPATSIEQLTEAQDGLIHAIIDVHTLIHLEMGKARS